MKKNYKAVIFDLDGTLLNSLEDIADSLNGVLEECGYPPHDYGAYRFLVGNGMRNLISRSLPRSLDDGDVIDRCAALMTERYRACCLNKSHLYEGVEQMMDALHTRDIKTSILSNKPDELTRMICAELLGKWRFEVVMGASGRFPRKPDPAAALYIAERMGVTPSGTVYVGDSDTDMETARAAGMLAVGVSWGFRPREELAASGADLIIDRPEELLQLL